MYKSICVELPKLLSDSSENTEIKDAQDVSVPSRISASKYWFLALSGSTFRSVEIPSQDNASMILHTKLYTQL